MSGQPSRSPTRQLVFGPFALDDATGELRKHGVRVRLPGQPLQILVCLIRQPGQIVTREEFQQQLWQGGTFVDFDHGLNAAMNRLRQVLGDSAEHPRYIETLPGRGYRFIAVVQDTLPQPVLVPVAPDAKKVVPVPPVTVHTGRKRWLWITAAGVIAGLIGGYLVANRLRTSSSAPRQRFSISQSNGYSLVVLPFLNLSANPDNEYFSDGLTEEITNALAHVEGLRVVARTTAFQFKGKAQDVRALAKQLHVNAVLEGSVRRDQNRLRVTAQLIDAQGGYHIWSQTYDREQEDIFKIQEDISRQIAQAVRPNGSSPRAVPGTGNLEAYNLYLKGRYEWGRWSRDGMLKSVSYFQQAIARDPNYALAWSGLAAAYAAQGGEPGLTPAREAMPKAREAALKALAIDDTLAEAHSALASVKLFFDWDAKGFEREIQRALDLNPNYADAHGLYAAYFDTMAKTEDALRERKRALELDPLNPFVNMAVGVPLYYGHRYDEAVEWPSKAVALDSSFAEAHNLLGSIYYSQHKYVQWLAETVRERDNKGLKPETTAALVAAYHTSGLAGYWREELKQAKAQERLGAVSPMTLARIYMELGKLDQAFDYLEKAYDARIGWVVFLGVNPLYEGLRTDRRFMEMVKRIGLKR